ncbi:hypothetical protein [uncultured Tateyamaria sp.]|uniref:hypothetical protein n=1 Tax=Tateyamaria sp. 1078 TaxID=3417464 RepID=UPI0026100829|nr:hypothetical protein [uncultured Tateyamaria sp.]
MSKTDTAKNTIPPFNISDFKRVPVPGEELHACMGLNKCAGQDKYGMDGAPGFDANACAGQGYCATTAMHSCHTNNDCANQGGCGLYGAESELRNPGLNACRSMGSCATPINAERFITTGGLRGTSVWARARKVFAAAYEKDGGTVGPQPQAFPHGPTAAWINTPPEGGSCTSYAACGASGMSGGGSCG